ncbi:MAG: Smr/MutS family protein [Longicatena sp.]
MFNEIDIHGLYVSEAKNCLDAYLNKLPKGIHEVSVIHGYQHGNALASFVRNQYTHKKCIRKMRSLNQGETILVLKD